MEKYKKLNNYICQYSVCYDYSGIWEKTKIVERKK